MVSPDIAVITSPGRWAVPEGMFSVSPSTPTTLALARRRASAAMAPNTAPAPPMSHFISSMPPAGLSERPPLSKHTPLPISATGGASGVAAVPAHDRDPGLARAALGDPEQRPHAELAHRGGAEDLDLEPDLAARACGTPRRSPRARARWRAPRPDRGPGRRRAPRPRRPPRPLWPASGSASRKVRPATSPAGSSSAVFWVWYLSNR